MKALIPAPANCEVRSVIKFLNAQSIALIEIHSTGLVFGKFRIHIPVLIKVIGVLFVVSLSHQGSVVLDLHYHDLFIKFINYKY